jgi:hypothetical protein
MFGKMFDLPPHVYNKQTLVALAATMEESGRFRRGGEDPEGGRTRAAGLHAGYTYLAQFLAHDLTFDPVSKMRRAPQPLRNFRTPRLDLDSLYGAGPLDQCYFYKDDNLTFLIEGEGGEIEDLPRTSTQRAVIGDPRNDSNLILSQLHLAFLKYHNRVVGELAGKSRSRPADGRFEEARRMVTWHYQWIVVNEFLPRIVDHRVIPCVLKREPYRFYDMTERPRECNKINEAQFIWRNRSHDYMPLEFSVGAFRFAHSMIRAEYQLNLGPEQQLLIFDVSASNDKTARDLRGFRSLPPGRRIDWRYFFALPHDKSANEVQLARPIDTLLARPLCSLPTEIAQDTTTHGRSLPLRDLMKGSTLELPAGQAVARALGVPEDCVLGTTKDLPTLPSNIASVEGLDAVKDNTPLWYYVLREAWLMHRGEKLGPVGSIIVAEVVLGLLRSDDTSYMKCAPDWQPTPGQFGCPRGEPKQFCMLELLNYAHGPSQTLAHSQ